MSQQQRLAPECAAVLAEISSYLDGDLGSAECARIDSHCAGCSGCAELVSGLRRTIGLCRDAAGASIPRSVRERAQARIRDLLNR